jgi:hypothetical protein
VESKRSDSGFGNVFARVGAGDFFSDSSAGRNVSTPGPLFTVALGGGECGTKRNVPVSVMGAGSRVVAWFGSATLLAGEVRFGPASKVSRFKSRDMPLEIETFAADAQNEVAERTTEHKPILSKFVFMGRKFEISCRPNSSNVRRLAPTTQPQP